MTHSDNDWKRAHDELVRIAGERAALDHDEGRWLLVARGARVHERFGFATFAEYVERVLGYGPRVTEEKLRVADALQRLPVLEAALAAGNLSWSAVRELTRVAVGETERDWLTAAKSRTVREVERLVSGRRPGDTPADPVRPEARRHTLRFDVTAETLATFREATAKLRRESDGALDDDAALLLMARAVLGGPTDAGRASYQIAMTVCEHCGAGTQQGKGEAIAVEPAVVEMAGCDAQHLHAGERATQTTPPATRRAVMRRDGGRCQVPDCCNAATRSSSTSTACVRAPMAATTIRNCSWFYAVCTIARCIAVASPSTDVRRPVSSSAMPTDRRTGRPRRPTTPRARCRRCAGSASSRAKRRGRSRAPT